MIFKKTFFKKKFDYTLEYNALIEKRNSLKESNQISEYQKVKSMLVYVETVYDYHLTEVINKMAKPFDFYKYGFSYVHPLTLYMIDDETKSNAKSATNKLIKREDLELPGIMDLDNPIHFIYSIRITERFEGVVRKFGLDDYSLKENGPTHIADHIEENLLDFKGIIYNALIFLRDFQNSGRKDKFLIIDGDYFDELIEKLNRFK